MLKSSLVGAFFNSTHEHAYRERTGAVVRASEIGPNVLSPRSMVRAPAGAPFVAALSITFTPCLVLVKPRKRWTDDRLGQTVTRLKTMLCLMC